MGTSLIAGVDEVGRGCLAGPVVAVAIILPSGFEHPLLRESKSLRSEQRRQLYPLLLEKALAVGVGMQGPAEIDRHNILRATLLAMQEALESLPLQPDRVRVDGPHPPACLFPVEACVKGDERFPEIAAASIVAKVLRDSIMDLLHRDWPHYGWDRNKGYPTPAHRQALQKWGPCPLHRRSFLGGKL